MLKKLLVTKYILIISEMSLAVQEKKKTETRVLLCWETTKNTECLLLKLLGHALFFVV